MNSFLRMMSLQLLIVTSLLLLVFGVDESFGNFCDEGPPGRYCYKDLGGWYECKIDPATLKMTETKHDCPINTRYKNPFLLILMI